jgi:hypothetical protein
MPTLTHAAWVFWILSLPGAGKTPDPSLGTSRVAIARQAAAPAQPAPKTATSGRQYFFSWGYNGNSYTKSDMHFSQPSLGNDFTLHDVQARDSKTWTNLFEHGLFVPQYNIRMGVFLNEKWGLELALDHIKWIVKDGQQVRVSGSLNDASVDTDVTLTPDVLEYQLNNGANPIFINLIRRWQLAGQPGRTGHFTFLAKAGGGFAVPHTENTLLGEPNEAGFQFFQAWNVDVAAAVRIHLYKPLYFEFEDKLLYARYFGVNVAEGTANHSVKANEWSWHLGLAFGK